MRSWDFDKICGYCILVPELVRNTKVVHELGVPGQFRQKKLHITNWLLLHAFIAYIQLFHNKKKNKYV